MLNLILQNQTDANSKIAKGIKILISKGKSILLKVFSEKILFNDELNSGN